MREYGSLVLEREKRPVTRAMMELGGAGDCKENARRALRRLRRQGRVRHGGGDTWLVFRPG